MDSKILTEDIIPNLKAKIDDKQTVVPIMANLGEIYTGTTPLSSPLDYTKVLVAVQANAQIVLVDNGASITVGTPEYIEITRAYVGKQSTVVLEFSVSNGFVDGPSASLYGVTYSLIVSSTSTVLNRIASANDQLLNVKSGSVTNSLLATNAVEDDNINWATIMGGTVYTPVDQSTNTLSLPVGDYVHDIRLYFEYTSVSTNGAVMILNQTALSGTTWVSRILNESDSGFFEEGSTTGTEFIWLARAATIGTSAGRMFVDGSILVQGKAVSANLNFRTTGARSSGFSTSGATLTSSSQQLVLVPTRNNGSVTSAYGYAISRKI